MSYQDIEYWQDMALGRAGTIVTLRARLATAEAERDEVNKRVEVLQTVRETLTDARLKAEAERDEYRSRWNAANEALGYAGTYGELTKEAPAVADLIVGHEWDNMRSLAQKQWLIETLRLTLQGRDADVKKYRTALDAAQASAKEWERKAMDVESHPVVVALIAERDKAVKKADDLFHECEEVLTAYGDPEEDEAFAQVVEKIAKNGDEGWGRAGELQQALTAAQSGEARAVEALADIANEGRMWHDDDCSWAGIENKCTCGYRKAAQQIAMILAEAQPALDWLAQQRAEAAAEALDVLAEYFSGRAFHVQKPAEGIYLEAMRECRDRAAALRAGATGGADA